MDTIKGNIRQEIKEENNRVFDENKESFSIIFQKISLSGVLYLISFLMIFAYTITKEAVNFNVGLPVISASELNLNDRIDQDARATQIFNRFFSLKTPFEVQMFVEDHAFLNEKDLPNKEITHAINKFVSSQNQKLAYDFEVLEVYQVRGDTYYSKKEKANFLTSSEYSFVVRQEELPVSGNSIIPEPEYYAYLINFDSLMNVKSISVAKDDLLVTKYRYLDFLATINADNLKSNLALNSTISSVSLSYFDIEKVEFNDFKIYQSISGVPTGSFKITINEDTYSGYIKVAPDGLLSIYIS